ncbi:MAG: hypothetical protein Q9M31_07750 [Mariprofundus sp.]|nr:hypothetical protein [Mariprofundus sp.]
MIYGFCISLLTACATLSPEKNARQPNTIGPYSSFSGRLIVIEPKRRWQVLIDWNAPTAAQGDLRLTHAASNTIIELHWQGEKMRIRDNLHNKSWQPITTSQLAEQGIVIHPRLLARFFLGDIPPTFQPKGVNQWQRKRNGTIVRLNWHSDSQRLTISDIKHGRLATLILQ